jgi:spore coat protein U-like protein
MVDLIFLRSALTIVIIAGAFTPFLSSPARANSVANSPVPISATVQATCTLSGTTLAFGTYTGSQIDTSAALSVTCTNTTAYTVGLDGGSHSSGGGETPNRRMGGPSGARLNYTLFSNAGRTTQWANSVGEGGSGIVSGTGDGSAQVLNVYGRLAAGQYVTPGGYTDTVTATVTY